MARRDLQRFLEAEIWLLIPADRLDQPPPITKGKRTGLPGYDSDDDSRGGGNFHLTDLEVVPLGGSRIRRWWWWRRQRRRERQRQA
jgi:hypothetical protein